MLHRQPAAAMHDSNLRRGDSGVVASAEACGQQCSRRDLGATGARSGVAQSGQAQDALQGRKRLDKRPELRPPPAKVLILGAGKVDQQRIPELKRVKARASRGQPGRAALGSFDHYHTGNGFWDSSMLGLDGAENLGTHMWEGLGTATWNGLGPP
ncbi:g10756 [Coccomyxa elongata]